MLKSNILHIINEIKTDDIDIGLLPSIILKKDFEHKYRHQPKTILYRNIGDIELEKLLKGQTIKGRYNLSRERQASENYKNVICTYPEKIIWNFPNSEKHQYLITLEVPTNLINQTGYGTYYASKNFESTKIWTGYRGKTKYEIPEVYLNEYDIGNLIHVQKTKDSEYTPDILSILNNLDITFI